MNEDLHIEKAAHLADKPGAENLATDRARAFVAQALGAKEEKKRRPVLLWSGMALAAAACVALGVILFRPSGNPAMNGGMGTPGKLQENLSIHAEGEKADTLNVETNDLLPIETIIEEGE